MKNDKGRKIKIDKEIRIGNRSFPENDAGMMTVEASVVVPLLSFIVLITIFFSIMILDLSVTKSETMIVADEAAQSWRAGSDLSSGEYDKKVLLGRSVTYLIRKAGSQAEGSAKIRLAERMKQRFMLMKPATMEVSSGIDRIRLSAELSTGLPFRQVRELFGSDSMSIGAGSTACFANWTEAVRLATVLKKTGEK